MDSPIALLKTSLDAPCVLATALKGPELGRAWIADPERNPQARAAIQEGPRQAENILWEPLVPGQFPPWLHVTFQLYAKGKNSSQASDPTGVHPSGFAGALFLVIEAEDENAFGVSIGDRFVLDDHSHGLLPMDSTLYRELHRAKCRLFEDPSTHRIIEAASVRLWMEPIPARS